MIESAHYCVAHSLPSAFFVSLSLSSLFERTSYAPSLDQSWAEVQWNTSIQNLQPLST